MTKHPEAKRPRSSAASEFSKATTPLVMALLVGLSFTLYLHTANPLFRFSDGGELATASHNLGVAHPTGYPFFLMGQKLWSFVLPIGNPCFRANLFSAVCAAVTLALIYLLCLRCTGPTAGFVAAGLLGLSQTFWLQATQSTVYALNLMLAALLLVLAFHTLERLGPGAVRTNRGNPGKSDWPNVLRAAALFFFVLGLGLGNHVTLALVPAALFVSRPRHFSRLLCVRGVALAALVFLLAGLSVYMYLPMRADADPAINWGDPSIWERLWEHVSQRDYKFKQASRSFGENLTVTGAFFGSMAKELGVLGASLALIGLIGGFARRRGLTIFLVLISLATLLVALLYGKGTYLEPVYCLPAYLAAAALAGLGASDLVSLVRGIKRPSAAGTRRRLAAAASILLVTLPVGLFASNYHSCDSSQNYYAYWHGQNILKTMPFGSTFFGETDTALFPLYYLKFVEGCRPDIKLYDRKWRVVQYFEQNDLQSSYNREMRIVERSHYAPVFYAEYPTVPAINIKLFGILLEAFLVEPLTGTIDFKRLYSNFLVEPKEDVFIDKWTKETRAKYFLLWGHQSELQDELVKARARFAEARRLGYENAGLMNNLSIYYKRAGMIEDAISAMERATEIEPTNARFLTRLGMLNYNTKKLDAAIDVLKRSLVIDGENADAAIYLANSYLLKGDQSQAENYFSKTLEIMPHNIHAHNNLGFIYKGQGKYDEAAEHFKHAIRIGTESYMPFFNLASVYALSGDTEKALKWLRRGRRYMSKRVVESIREHVDFDSIRADKRFEEVLGSDD